MTLAPRLILAGLVACLWILASPTHLVAQVKDPTERTGGATVRGTAIYADTGRPIRNAGVRMISDVNAMWGRNAVTNGRGQFVLKDVAAGRCILHVDAPGAILTIEIEMMCLLSPATPKSRSSSLWTRKIRMASRSR